MSITNRMHKEIMIRSKTFSLTKANKTQNPTINNVLQSILTAAQTLTTTKNQDKPWPVEYHTHTHTKHTH